MLIIRRWKLHTKYFTSCFSFTFIDSASDIKSQLTDSDVDLNTAEPPPTLKSPEQTVVSPSNEETVEEVTTTFYSTTSG